MNQKQELAIFGGSFNPAGLHHLKIIEELLSHFKKVIIIPCGPRPDKSSTNETSTFHRQKISELAFSNIKNTILDLSDLKKVEFTPSIELYEHFSKNFSCSLVVGADLIQGGAENKSEIQRSWHKGVELWNKANFAILTRDSNKLDTKDLPPRSLLINIMVPGSSREIRDLIKINGDAKDLLPASVYQYIQDNNLYK